MNQILKNTLSLTLGIGLISFSVFAKEVVITPKTKKINPVHFTLAYSSIDWYTVEQNQNQGKNQKNFEYGLMMCDDSYFSDLEIRFEGTVGKDTKVTSDNCRLLGYWTDRYETVLKFSGPDASSCTIEVIRKDENTKDPKAKDLVMTYEIGDAC